MAYIGSGIFAQARRIPSDAVSQSIGLRDGSDRLRSTLRILEAAMRGGAAVAGDQAARRGAERLFDLSRKMRVTLHGDGRVDVKGAPEEFLRGELLAQNIVAESHAPREAVEQTLSSGSQEDQVPKSDPLEPLYQIVDKHVGYRIPRPTDPDIFEKLQTLEGVAELNRELGQPPEAAGRTWKNLRSGKRTADQLHRFIAEFRVRKLASIAEAMRPAIDEVQDITSRTASAEKEKLETQRSKIDRLTTIVDQADFSEYPDQEWRSIVEDRFGEPVSDFQMSRITKKAIRDQRTRAISDYKEFKSSIGNFDTLEAAQQAFPWYSALDESKKEQFAADWRVSARNRIADEKKDALELKKLSLDTAPLPTVGVREAAIASLPSGTQALIKKIASYEMDLKAVTSLRGGERERIASLVAQYDPTFDMSQYTARAATRKDFTSGKAAGNIRSINTAVKHLDSLANAAEKLDNRAVQLWNALANKVITSVGDPRVVRFNSAANAVESEMASVFKGMGATDQEIKAWRDQLNASQSPEQLNVAIDTMIELMGGRLAALENQWQTNMGKPVDFRILSPESDRILKELGADIRGGTAGPNAITAPDGSEWRDNGDGTVTRIK